VAEIEPPGLIYQFLDHRIPDIESLLQEIQARFGNEMMYRRGNIGNSLRRAHASASNAYESNSRMLQSKDL
jgi:glycosyltransferase A (GT-A) superfamily protein (DUF2064 family)